MGNTAWCAGEHSRDDVREREKLALCVDTVSRAGGGGADADATLSDCATATALRGGDAQASTAGTMFAGEKLALCVDAVSG